MKQDKLITITKSVESSWSDTQDDSKKVDRYREVWQYDEGWNICE